MNTTTATNAIIPLPYPSFMNKFPFLHGASIQGGSKKTRRQKKSRTQKQKVSRKQKSRRIQTKKSCRK